MRERLRGRLDFDRARVELQRSVHVSFELDRFSFFEQLSCASPTEEIFTHGVQKVVREHRTWPQERKSPHASCPHMILSRPHTPAIASRRSSEETGFSRTMFESELIKACAR